MPKIFFIGFNKTATFALHIFFKKHGYISYHNKAVRKNNRILALTIHQNFLDKKWLLDGIDDANVYSDLHFSNYKQVVEANKYFKYLDLQYPGSYFILQTRNIYDWIESRLNHPKLAERHMSALGLTSLIDLEEYWLKENYDTTKNILNYFENKEKFLVYNIDNDNISTLCNFLSKDYKLDNANWKRINVTGQYFIDEFNL